MNTSNCLQKINSYIILIPLLTIFALPKEVYACACCANAGEWSQTSNKLDDYEFKEINRLQFTPTAKIYQSARGENIGVDSNSTNYTLSLTKKQRIWNFLFKDEQGKTGTLSLTIPTNGVTFKTDLYEKPQAGGSGTQLYKELRLEGKVTGNGIFAKGIAPNTKFRLVLQGRGGACMTAEDFKTWNLQIFGSHGNYSFYSSLK
ncbi:hypothetical protein CK510_02380 [Brunnivagina elsteri CCALA 953]|uniref:Uncharacterized protein n=2 Tax=Brunnivagina TaxID=3344733 RepID=A0A2A2TPP7_9CYAN|nr:hypothetical protein CK510_02380 [Calothrix elsteri CCALA 953]